MKRPFEEELEEGELRPAPKKLDTKKHTDKYFDKIERLIETIQSVLDRYKTRSPLTFLERITDFVKEEVMVLVRHFRNLHQGDLYVRTLLHRVYKYLQLIGEKKVDESRGFTEDNRHVSLILSIEIRGIAALNCFNSRIDYNHLKAIMWSINMLLIEKGDWFFKYTLYTRNIPIALYVMKDIEYIRDLLKCKREYVL